MVILAYFSVHDPCSIDTSFLGVAYLRDEVVWGVWGVWGDGEMGRWGEQDKKYW
ncbi:hypothetical protein [Okeania sp. KiyG1]|uniref:hypothetical protein n=1 Tax=Okeania sp. KiyG1 TaxID=2720165 RepID=UPI001924994A|nr:hypothetical protein [Okeania sp. KiyG1]